MSKFCARGARKVPFWDKILSIGMECRRFFKFKIEFMFKSYLNGLRRTWYQTPESDPRKLNTIKYTPEAVYLMP